MTRMLSGDRGCQALGYRLPTAYVALLRERNGGIPRRLCFPTTFSNSWADDHIAISAILGVGAHWWSIDSDTGSRYMVKEWEYPDIGIVICDTPSAGHDTVMLDYTTCGPEGEPSVAYIDEDRVPRQLAPTFALFLEDLVPCQNYLSDDGV